MLAPLEAGAAAGDLTRVVQGIATGIGFVGAGAILKLEGQGQVKGLTTASTVWIAAAVGMAVGVGLFWVSAVGTALGLCILVVLRRLEGLLAHPHAHDTT